MSQLNVTEIWVNKYQLEQTKLNHFSIDTDALTEGQVVLAVESFGFSANNITYAALGEGMGYWGFFPAEDNFGIVPIWGFALVAASADPNIKVGEKVFGYLPFASHLLIDTCKTTEQGFFDISSKRKSISSVYDNYLYCAKDPGYDPTLEPWQLNFRPLFMTSFVLDDFVGEQLSAQVENVVLTSASSKTAYGTAHLLMKHKANRAQPYKVIGLTSAANLDFVNQIGCYDQVLSYEEVGHLKGSSWVLDFAANGSLLATLAEHLAEDLNKVTLIGATDWQAQQKPNKREIQAEIFFAPSQVKKRTDELGQKGFLMGYAEAWQSFFSCVGNSMEVHQYKSSEALVKLYLDTLSGKVDVKGMNVASF